MKIYQCIFLLFLLPLLTGCGTAWVVRQTPTGGTIGYKGYSSDESATKAVAALIPCSSYRMVSDELRSQAYQYTTLAPVTSQTNSSGTIYNAYSGNYYVNGQQTQTNYVPVTNTGQDNWREFTYDCFQDNSSSASISPAYDKDYSTCTWVDVGPGTRVLRCPDKN